MNKKSLGGVLRSEWGKSTSGWVSGKERFGRGLGTFAREFRKFLKVSKGTRTGWQRQCFLLCFSFTRQSLLKVNRLNPSSFQRKVRKNKLKKKFLLVPHSIHSCLLILGGCCSDRINPWNLSCSKGHFYTWKVLFISFTPELGPIVNNCRYFCTTPDSVNRHPKNHLQFFRL